MVENKMWPDKITDNWSGRWKHKKDGEYVLKKEGVHEKGTKGSKLHWNEIDSSYGIQQESW